MVQKENPQGKHYQIIVRGHLESDLHPWLDGLKIKNLPNGEAILSGPVTDQAMLHGLLIKIRDLGLPLISVNTVELKEGEKKEN